MIFRDSVSRHDIVPGMIGSGKLYVALVAAWVLWPAAPAVAATSDLRAAFARAFPGYVVLQLEDFDPDIVRFHRERPDLFPDGRTPSWLPGDYDGDGTMDVAVLAKKRGSGGSCDIGLFAIITASGRKLHSSGGSCLSSRDTIVYHPPGYEVEYLTDRYDMPDATEEEMFAKKVLPFASVEYINWEIAAGVYYWNPETRRMETDSTAD